VTSKLVVFHPAALAEAEAATDGSHKSFSFSLFEAALCSFLAAHVGRADKRSGHRILSREEGRGRFAIELGVTRAWSPEYKDAGMGLRRNAKRRLHEGVGPDWRFSNAVETRDGGMPFTMYE
jgi:hypothetical protein